MRQRAVSHGAARPAADADGGEAVWPLPTHVAVIMDGNGRWAVARGLSRSEGHRAGTENLAAILGLAEAVERSTLKVEVWTSISAAIALLTGDNPRPVHAGVGRLV